jgi:SET domain-containing protein
MSYVLTSPKKVEVRESSIHGYGVFAIEPIRTGEIIEECHLIKIPIKMGHIPQFMVDYKFNYPSGQKPEEYVLPLGYGCIYNHSHENNAMWRTHQERKLFEFYAIRDIEVGEEVCTNYGGKRYWDTLEEIKKSHNNSLI